MIKQSKMKKTITVFRNVNAHLGAIKCNQDFQRLNVQCFRRALSTSEKQYVKNAILASSLGAHSDLAAPGVAERIV
jgi:hypothetical protein